jgi:hypothetical protein
MMETIQIRISSELATQLRPYYQQLPQILELGLRHLKNQASEQEQVTQALLSTGFIQHLAVEKVDESDATHQPPPVLPGPPTSEVITAQRRGVA